MQKGERPLLDPALFKDKIVFVASTAAGTYVLRVTPLSPFTPGVLIHMTALDNLLRGHAMAAAPPSAFVLTTLVLCVGTAWAFALVQRQALKFLLIAGLAVAYYGLVVHAFTGHEVWMELVFPEGALALTYAVSATVEYLTEGRQRLAGLRRGPGEPGGARSTAQGVGSARLSGDRRAHWDQFRTAGRREHGLPGADGVYCHGRQREPGVPSGRGQQVLRYVDPPGPADVRAGPTRYRGAGSGHAAGEGQAGAGGGVRTTGPERDAVGGEATRGRRVSGWARRLQATGVRQGQGTLRSRAGAGPVRWAVQGLPASGAGVPGDPSSARLE